MMVFNFNRVISNVVGLFYITCIREPCILFGRVQSGSGCMCLRHIKGSCGHVLGRFWFSIVSFFRGQNPRCDPLHLLKRFIAGSLLGFVLVCDQELTSPGCASDFLGSLHLLIVLEVRVEEELGYWREDLSGLQV